MRALLVILLLLQTVVIFPQGKSPAIPGKPFITARSDPFGNMASATIGVKGGRLRSVDGGLEVVIPENALDGDKQITIQSSHNDLNDIDEGAYQLEPSGIPFKKPVQLIFHDTGSFENPDIKSIGWQDENGLWHYAGNIVVDSLNKIISCLAPHFSRWSRFDKIYLFPTSASVKVNKRLTLLVQSFDDILDAARDEIITPGGSEDDDLLVSPHYIHYYMKEWTVNGIVNGNSEVGSISRTQDKRRFIFNAPSVIPDANPVAVSVQLYSNDNRKKLLLTCNVLIIGDQYRLTYTQFSDMGVFFVHDSSTCIINMLKRDVRLTQIVNHKAWADWNAGGMCPGEWKNKESFKGLVEINGIAGSQITAPASEGGYPNVNIVFLPSLGNTPSYLEKCPGGTHFVPSMSIPGVPTGINFDIDGDDVIIHAAGKTGRNVLVIGSRGYKTTISIHKLPS